MKLEEMEETYCPWRNGNCLGERCMDCSAWGHCEEYPPECSEYQPEEAAEGAV